jgi:hypothetical protein
MLSNKSLCADKICHVCDSHVRVIDLAGIIWHTIRHDGVYEPRDAGRNQHQPQATREAIMLSTYIGLFITILFLGTLALGRDVTQSAEGLVNVYLFEDDWTEELNCDDLTPVACLAARGALDESRLHCGRFNLTSEGELTIGKNQQLSPLTDHGGAVLLGLGPWGPIAKWSKMETNSDHVWKTRA